MKSWFVVQRSFACVITGVCVSLMLASGQIAKAQSTTVAATVALRQLDGRVPPPLKEEVTALADSVARTGLPVALLVDKTLEGVSKGADERRIIAAVRAVASELRVASESLGPSSEPELAAGVAALRAGSSADGLIQLRHALPGRTLVVPLSVLASLLADGAPAPSALLAVVAHARQRDDAGLLAYGRVVSQDIASGIAPLTAISASHASNAGTALTDAFHPAAIPKRPTPKPKP